LTDSLGGSGEALVKRVDLAPLLSEISDLDDLETEASALLEQARATLKTAIGEAYGIVAPGYRALYPKSYPQRWDSAALDQIKKDAIKIVNQPVFDYEELEANYKAVTDLLLTLIKAKAAKKEPQRTLRIYSTGD
jgi:hypothetical protein